jgi:hypothetical protein
MGGATMNKVTIRQGNKTIEFLVQHFYDIPAVIEREFDIPVNIPTAEQARLANECDYPVQPIYIKIMNPESHNTHIEINYITLYNQ